MGRSDPFPAWPFLLGALVFIGLGIWLVSAGGAVFGWFLVAAALILFAFAVRQGRRAMGGTPEVSAPEGPASVPAPSQEASGGLSAYYENEAAVRAMQKETRNLCKECGSPVLSKASECPTCGSPLR